MVPLGAITYFISSLLTAFHSLMYTSVVDDPTVIELAKKLGKDPAALLISWAVQRGTSVLPKSVTPSRIESNFQGTVPHPESSIANTEIPFVL